MSKVARLITCCLVLGVAAPTVLAAQEEEEEAPPQTLVMSAFQCDWSQISDVMSEMELQVPIWEALVDEGAMASAGTFVHAWADEWNVVRYIIAEDVAAAIDANSEANSRFADQHPDANVFGEACPMHKDNFYQFGPVADASGAPSGGNPALVLSMYRCETNRIGDVFDDWEQYAQPVYEAQIQEGALRGAGTFAHSWADEWNVGLYWVAEDAQTFLDAWGDFTQRIGEARGDAPAVLNEACPVHRDAIYTLGPRTGMDDDGEE